MSKFSRRLIAVLFAVSLPVVSANADWEADFTASSTKKDFPKSSGKFYSKIDRFRVDAKIPMEMSIYAKANATKVDAAVHSFHMRMTSNLAKFSAQIPACLSSAFEECVKKFGLKKEKEVPCGENGADKTCEVFVGGKGMKGVKRLELWHWKGEKEPILTKSILIKTDGAEIRTEFTGISRKAHDDSFYEVPAGYANAGALEKFLGDFKGKSE